MSESGKRDRLLFDDLKGAKNVVTAECLDERLSGKHLLDAGRRVYRVERVWAEGKAKDFDFTFCLIPDGGESAPSFAQTEQFASYTFVDPARREDPGWWSVDLEAEVYKQELIYAYCWRKLNGLGKRAKREGALRLLRTCLRELNWTLQKLKALAYVLQGVDPDSIAPFLNRECLPTIRSEVTEAKAIVRTGSVVVELRGQDVEGGEGAIQLGCPEFVKVWERALFAANDDRANEAREESLRLSRRHHQAVGRVTGPLVRRQRHAKDGLDRYGHHCLVICHREAQHWYDLAFAEILRRLVAARLFWVEGGVVWLLDRGVSEVSVACFSPFYVSERMDVFFPHAGEADMGEFTALVHEYRGFLVDWFNRFTSGVEVSLEEMVERKVPQLTPDSFCEDVEHLTRAEEDLWNLAFSSAQKATTLREDVLRIEAELFYDWRDPNAFPYPRPAEQISETQRQAFWRMWHFRVLLGTFWDGDVHKREAMTRELGERLDLKRRMQQNALNLWVLGLYYREKSPHVERAEAPIQQRVPDEEFVRKRVRGRPFIRYLLLAGIALALAYLFSGMEGLLERSRRVRERFRMVSSAPVETQARQQEAAERGEGHAAQADSGGRAGADTAQRSQPRSGEREQLGRQASPTGRDEADRSGEAGASGTTEDGSDDAELVDGVRRRRSWPLVLFNVLFVAVAGVFGWLLVHPSRMRDRRRRHMLSRYLRDDVRRRPDVYRVDDDGVHFDWDVLRNFEPADAAHIHRYRGAFTSYREKFQSVFADSMVDGLWRHRLEALFLREVYLAMERDYLENARVPISRDLLPLFPPLRVNAKHRVFLRKGLVETAYDPEETRNLFDTMLRTSSTLGLEEKLRRIEREERTYLDVLFGDKRWFTVLYVAGSLTFLYLGLLLGSAPGQEITVWRGVTRFLLGGLSVLLFLATLVLAGVRIYHRWFGFPRAHRDAWKKVRFRLRDFPLSRFSHWVELKPNRWINLRTKMHCMRDRLSSQDVPGEFLHFTCELPNTLEVSFRIRADFARYIPGVQEVVQRHLKAYLHGKRARRTGHKMITVDMMAMSFHFSEVYNPNGRMSYVLVRDAFEVLKDRPSLMRVLVVGHILFQTVQLLEIEPVAYEFPQPLEHFKNILEATGAGRAFFDEHFRLGDRGRYGLYSYGQWGHFRPIMRMVAADAEVNRHEIRRRPYTLSELNEQLNGLGMFEVEGHFTSNRFFAHRYDRFAHKDVKCGIVFIEEELGDEQLRVKSHDIKEYVCKRSMLAGTGGRLYVVPPAERIRVDSSVDAETGIDFPDANGEPLRIEPPLAFPVTSKK